MSNQEKLFIVVSPSHHKKPRTLFLNKTNSGKIIWCDFVPGITTLWLLSEAQEFAANSPVAIWFIEDKDWISSLETGDMPKFADILKYAQKAGSQILQHCNYALPPILAPSERQLADDALREIAAQLHNQQTVCNTKDTPIVMLPDGERDDDADYIYLLYTLTADNQLTYYRSENPLQTILHKKQLAEVFTKAEAQAKTMFADEDGCMWHVEKVNKVIAKEAEEANKNVIDGLKQTFGDNPKLVTLPKEEQPEAKKRIAYRLFSKSNKGTKFFFQSHGEKDRNQIRVDGYAFDLFRTEEEAQFTADVLNTKEKEVYRASDWQVEQVEF